MDHFTTLDVVKYYDMVQKCSSAGFPIGYVVQYVVMKIINSMTDVSVRDAFKSLDDWMYVGMTFPKTMTDAKIVIPFEVKEGTWNEREYLWYKDIVDEHIVGERHFSLLRCGYYTRRTLADAPKLFHVFCDLICNKFKSDENLMCILDDLIKRVDSMSS